MQVGESVAVVMADQDDGKCVFCSKNHAEPKKEDIKETAPADSGWHRKTMTGVFEKIKAKEAIYPHGVFPPSYTYQGHHCVALSALVIDANSKSPKDKWLRLNHFLKKIGFYPNRIQNCIGLPARKSYGDFNNFWLAIDANAPLQMHGPGHDEDYFNQVQRLIITLISVITAEEFCKELDKSEWEKALKDGIESIENYAFNKLAGNDSSWCLHRDEQRKAIEIYKGPTDQTFEVRGANDSKKYYKGQGNSDKKIIFPNPNLNEGPFKDE